METWCVRGGVWSGRAVRRVHDAVGGGGGRGVVSWRKKDFVRSFTLTLSELGSSGHKSGVILLKF